MSNMLPTMPPTMPPGSESESTGESSILTPGGTPAPAATARHRRAVINSAVLAMAAMLGPGPSDVPVRRVRRRAGFAIALDANRNIVAITREQSAATDAAREAKAVEKRRRKNRLRLQQQRQQPRAQSPEER